MALLQWPPKLLCPGAGWVSWGAGQVRQRTSSTSPQWGGGVLRLYVKENPKLSSERFRRLSSTPLVVLRPLPSVEAWPGQRLTELHRLKPAFRPPFSS